MKVYQNIITIKTKGGGVFHDLTSILKDELKKSDVKNGVLIISVWHTTAAVTLQEADADVHHDTTLVLDHITPAHLPLQHTYEGVINAKAHQKAQLIGTFTVIPVKNRSLLLGTWQTPFLIEFFKPMERKVAILILGV